MESNLELTSHPLCGHPKGIIVVTEFINNTLKYFCVALLSIFKEVALIESFILLSERPRN